MVNRLIPLALLTAMIAPMHAQMNGTPAEQQARTLGLVSVDVENGTVGDVLKILRKQVGHALKPSFMAPAVLQNRVTLKFHQQPLGKVLAALGLWPGRRRPGSPSLDHLTLLGEQPLVAHHPGVSLRLRTHKWQRDEVHGIVVITEAIREGVAPMFFDVDKVTLEDGSELQIETCALHSPQKVFIPNPPKQKVLRVTIKGSCFAQHRIPISIKAPKPDAKYTEGPFTISLADWPHVSVTSKEAYPRLAMQHLVSWVSVEAKPGAQATESPDAIGLGAGGRFRSRIKAWCGCSRQPLKRRSNEPSPTELVKTAHGSTSIAEPVPQLSGIASLKVHLAVPKEHPFTSTFELPAKR